MSKRFKEIAKHSIGSNILVDIGCDHGYEILEAFKLGSIKKAYAIDINKLPLENCKNTFKKYNFDIEFIVSDGLINFNNKFDICFICGMGSDLIINIINSSINKFLEGTKLVLASNKNRRILREYLSKNKFEIIDEECFYDKSKYYEVIVCKKVNYDVSYSYVELLYGPILIKRMGDDFCFHLRSLYNFYKNFKKFDNELEIIKKLLRSD